MIRTVLTLRTSARAIALGTLLLTPSLAFAQAAPSPYTSATRYDAANRVVGTIAPDPDGVGSLKLAASRIAYDASGRVIKVETGELAVWKPESIAPANWGADFNVLSSAETVYDNLDRKIQDLGKASNGTIVSAAQYTYDAAGRLDCAVTRMNLSAIPAVGSNACTIGTAGSSGNDRITKNVYNVASQLLVVKKAFGTPRAQDYVTYTYTLNGKQATVKDANGNLASMTYDGHDRQTRWTFPSKTTVGQINAADYEQYAYDANGNRTSLRKRDGSVIAYTYDNLNRPTVKDVDATNLRTTLAATHKRDVYYGYDLRGLQLYARFDSASGEGVASAYDGFGRTISSSINMDGITRTLSYARNAIGNRTSLTWMDGNVTAYSYDGLNRMNTLYEGPLASNINMLTYGYNNRGMRSNQTGRFAQVSTFTPDSAGRLASIAHDVTGTANDVTYGLDAYNPSSQVTQRSTSNDAYVWTGAVNVSRSYAVNGLNQYTSAGSAVFGYDLNGNLTSDGTNSYGYDVENRLIQASGASNATLRYDPLGRLYETSAGTVATTTRFLHDGDELVAEFNASGTLLRRYLHGVSVDDPVVAYEGSGFTNPKWLHSNHQGSIIAVSDNTGAVTAKNTFDEWGIPGSSNASIAAGGRFSYTGQAWLPELGMYYYKARIYSATLGRFMQTDPVGYADQMNIYGYVGNDPVNNVDSTGLACEDNEETGFCSNSRSYEQLDKVYQNTTRFFAGASIVSAALNSVNGRFAGLAVSSSTGKYLQSLNNALRKDNLNYVSKLFANGKSVLENNKAFVRFEQGRVQNALDTLQKTNQKLYDQVVNESNDGLNGIRGATYSGIYDSAYALAAQDAKSNLGVDKLDFANKNHRIAIGDALLKNVMQAGDCTKTGSLVKTC